MECKVTYQALVTNYMTYGHLPSWQRPKWTSLNSFDASFPMISGIGSKSVNRIRLKDHFNHILLVTYSFCSLQQTLSFMDLHDPQCSFKMHLGSLWPCQLKRDCFSRSIFAFLYQDGTWCLWHLLQFSAILYRLHASSLFKCTMWQHTRLWRSLSKCNSALFFARLSASNVGTKFTQFKKVFIGQSFNYWTQFAMGKHGTNNDITNLLCHLWLCGYTRNRKFI